MRAWYLYTIAFAAVVSVAACNDSPIQPKEKIELRATFIARSIAKYDRQAPMCQSPAKPNGVKDASNWRYGCFCGQGYPTIADSLPESDRVAKYFEVGPKDDIDRACRDHDICWTEFGDGDPSCTQIYTQALDELFDGYMQARKSLPEKIEGRRPFSKCTQTILDQQFAFSTIFASAKYEGFLENLSAKIARILFGTPILGAAAVVGSGTAEYPSPEEKCTKPAKRE